MTGDAPSSSGRDGGLSCSGKPQGFGGLRKNFKPQQKKKAPSVPAPNSQSKCILRSSCRSPQVRAPLPGSTLHSRSCRCRPGYLTLGLHTHNARRKDNMQPQ